MSARFISFLWNSDIRLRVAERVAVIIAAAIFLLALAFMAGEAAPALERLGFGQFFLDARWYPLEGEFGAAAMLAGTGLAALGAVAIAAPVGVFSALFCHFYAPRGVGFLYRRMMVLLAAVPSVVFGLWGLTVLVPVIARIEPPGPSLLAATLVLALMILPTVAVTADAAIGAVPSESVRGGAALALGRWSVIRRLVLPAAAGGIGTGILLALARAIGETMAVVMVAGNVPRMPDSLFAPVRTVTATIALEMGYATAEHRAILFAVGLLLTVFVGALVTIAMRREGNRPDE